MSFRKTCKLEYYIFNMVQEDKTEIIWLIDKDGYNDFNIINIKAITEFNEITPAYGDSFEATLYKGIVFFNGK